MIKFDTVLGEVVELSNEDIAELDTMSLDDILATMG